MQFEVIFYEMTDGQKPIEDFLKALDVKMRAKVVLMMELLEKKGTELREPYSKALGDGIFELRCKLGSNVSRTLYFFFSGAKIIITNGFIKKTRKTPQRELELAKARRAEYVRRMQHEDIATIQSGANDG